MVAFVAELAPRGLPVTARERIGLIAGSGRFPVLFAETARRRGVDVVAVGARGRDATRRSAASSSAITWVHAGPARGA